MKPPRATSGGTVESLWPRAELTSEGLAIRARLVGGFELAPLNLELMAESERGAALENVGALYDAIPCPFQLLSVPALRDPAEHLAQLEERLENRAARRAFGAYAALYRELSSAPRRPLRRTYLLLDVASAVELRRTLDLIARVAQERGIAIREVEPRQLVELWSSVARVGASYRLGIHAAEGDDLVAALHLGPRWPAEVPPGWLAGPLAADGVAAVSMRARPLSRAEAMAFMTTRLREVRAGERLASERGDLADPERERLGETAAQARRTAHLGTGRIYFVDTILLVEAADAATLGDRLDALRLEARGLQLELEPATFRVGEAWLSALPGPVREPVGERNLATPSLAASLMHAASDLYEPSGHLYGRARTSGAPIVLDRFAHTSHNAIVLGQTGTGKTMFTGVEMSRCFLRGIRILAVDPLGDYRRLTQELGGTYVELGGSAPGLDPFALGAAAGEGALTSRLAMLTRLVAAMAGGLTRDERPALDRALRGAYAATGIGPDPSTHDRRPPTLAGVAEQLEQIPGGRPVAHRLERWATGSLADLFAGDALPLDRRFLVVGLARLADPEVRSVAQFAALSLLWDAVRRDLTPKLVVVDEAWKVMRQPSGAEFVEELARSARHYHAGLQLATQDIVEFFRSDFGEAVVKQCDLRVLLGQTPEGADALARYFDLTAPERRALVHARPGDGLLFVGRSHLAFESVVSRREYAALTTRPADLLEQLT